MQNFLTLLVPKRWDLLEEVKITALPRNLSGD